MKRVLLHALVAALLVAPGAAFAQTVGTLVGHVYDQSGTPLKGVKVVLTSPTQIGGAKTTNTDAEGTFRFPALTPGFFTITVSAPKLKTLVQQNVKVLAVTTTEVDLVMEVESAEEQVRIVQKAPPVNTTDARVGENFDQDFVNNLPVSSRTFQGVAALTPGVSDGGDGNPNIRGGARFNNNFTVDGFQTSDPVTHTFTENFTFIAMNQLQVRTASFGAEHSDTLGGGVNIVTKSGSNRFEGDAVFTYEDHNMRFFKDARDIGTHRLMVAELALGGPILKDRLWFFASAQGVSNISTLPRDPILGAHPSFNVIGFTGTFKLTYQLGTRHKIEFNTRYEPGDFNNILQSPLVEPEAEARQYQATRFFGLEWHSILTDELVLSMRAGINQNNVNVEPQSCRWDRANCANVPGIIDIGSGILRQNYTSQSRTLRQTVQFAGAVEWFKETRRFGSHHLRFGGRAQFDRSESAETTPGDAIERVITTGMMEPERVSREETCSTDPKNLNGVCNHNWLYSDIGARKFLVFLSEAWKPTRYLTLKPEVAMHITNSRNDKGKLVTDALAFTPHLSVAWDPTKDGRTVIRGSFNNYLDHGFLALASFTSRALFQKRCNWDPQAMAYIRDCTSEGGDSGTTVGLPCGPDGLNPDGTRCDTKLRLPRVWEYTIGAEREIVTGVTLGLDYIYRKFVHQWEDLETNAVWNRAGTGLERSGMWKTGRAQFIFDLETPDEARRVYHSVTVAARKREGVLKMLLSYTWTKYEGTDDSSIASLYLDNPGQSQFWYGPMSTDRRHDVRAQFTYMLTNYASLGVIYQYLSGGPYNRRYYDPTFQAFSAFRTRRGYDTRGTLSLDDDVPLRHADINSLDVQARMSLFPFIRQYVDIFFDLQNLLGLRTTTSVIEQDGPFFARPVGRMPPMNARLGLQYRFR
jgi:hypothetical protein